MDNSVVRLFNYLIQPGFVWTKFPSDSRTPTARQDFGGCAIGDKIYYLGGSSVGDKKLEKDTTSLRLEIFDTTSATWLDPLIVDFPVPGDQQLRYSCPRLVATGNILWVPFGGSHQCGLDVETKQWKHIYKVDPNMDASSVYTNVIGHADGVLFGLDTHRGELDTFDCASGKAERIKDPQGAVPYDRGDAAFFNVGGVLLLFTRASYASNGFYCYTYDHKRRVFYDLPTTKSNEELKVGGNKLVIEGLLGRHLVVTNGEWRKPFGNVVYCDLEEGIWKEAVPTGDIPNKEAIVDPVIVGSKVYMWCVDKTNAMFVLEARNLPSAAAVSEWQGRFAKRWEDKFATYKAPVKIEDNFVESDVPAERDLILDTSLSHCQWQKPTFHRDMAKSIVDLFKKTSVVDFNFIRHNLPLEDKANAPPDGIVFHKNYIHYLTLAYNNHFSVVLSPDIVFYTLLAELADSVKGAPEAFQHLFTSLQGSEKQTLIFLQGDPSVIDLDQIIAQIAKQSPSDASLFTANFTTSTVDSRLACQAAFADAMSAYFNYAGTLCGLPRVRVLGTKSDWVALEGKIAQWRTLIGPVNPRLEHWLANSHDAIHEIHTNRKTEFWKSMFGIDTCSSGHTDKVKGWITRLYRNGGSYKNRGVMEYSGDDFYNYESHLSTVRWSNLESGRKFALHTGLLYSKIDAPTDASPAIDREFPFLLPQFAHLVREESARIKPEDYKAYLSTLTPTDRNFIELYQWAIDPPLVFESSRAAKRQKVNALVGITEKMIERAKQGIADQIEEFEFEWDFGQLFGGASERVAADTTPESPSLIRIASNFAEVFRISKVTKTVRLERSNKLFKLYGGLIFEGLVGSPSVETLVINDAFPGWDTSLAKVLVHPGCKVKTLSIPGCSSPKLASALAKSTAPFQSIKLIQEADEEGWRAILGRLLLPQGQRLQSVATRTSPNDLGKLVVSQFFMDHASDITLDTLGMTFGAAKLTAESLVYQGLVHFFAHAKVRVVNVEEVPNGTALLKAVASNRRVESMALSSSLTAEQLAILATNKSVKSLSINGLKLPGGAGAILGGWMAAREFESVTLFKADLPAKETTPILNALAASKSIKSFSLVKQPIEPDTAANLAAVLGSANYAGCLRSLSFQSCQLESGAGLKLIQALATNSTITNLDLESCLRCSDEVLVALAKSLATNRSLESLQLGYAKFRRSNLMALAEAITAHNHTLKSIFLGYWRDGLDTRARHPRRARPQSRRGPLDRSRNFHPRSRQRQ